ncbi:HD domain-containing protein [Pseudonocardia lacus]|jgi:putative nucleotidyltransferase with HDIG domain|uniref:HD domain-containing protein n=1 Tax=Pseudonocardia lacus TaxID=2835865 RepID=UPI001BDBFBFF|nr:HD domain-containing protein [Pseudonocardia lacus]
MTTGITDPKVTAAEVLETFPELTGIADGALRDAVVEIWQEVLQESDWDHLDQVPKHPVKLPASSSLVDHTRAVTQMAVAVAEVAERVRGIPFDRDLLIACANLHDVSKLKEFEPSAEGGRASRFGYLVQHGVYGAHKMWQKNLPLEMVHNILVHTTTSRYLPQTWEAVIVHYVDYLDSDGLNLQHGVPLNIKK